MTGGFNLGWLDKSDEQIDDDEVKAINREVNAAAARQLREMGRLYYEVFSAGRGPELLMAMRERTIEKPLMVMGGVIGDQPEISISPSDWAFFREGQNSVIRHIENMLRHAVRSENEEEATNA